MNGNEYLVVDKEIPPPSWRASTPAEYSRMLHMIWSEEEFPKWTFDRLTKKFGTAYLDLIYYAYSCCSGSMSDEEFCASFGGIPYPFFLNKIKHQTTFKPLN